MKKPFLLCIVLIFLLTGCSKKITFSDIDFSNVDYVEIFDGHNGEYYYVTEETQYKLVEYVAKMTGTLVGDTKGYYGARYMLVFKQGEDIVLSIGLGDDKIFTYDENADADYSNCYKADMQNEEYSKFINLIKESCVETQ